MQVVTLRLIKQFVQIKPDAKAQHRWLSFLRFYLAIGLQYILMGCAGMDVQETYYVAVPSGDNTNYYRVRVSANAENGKASYNAAWFSAYSVDSLYSDVSTSGAAAQLNVEKDIRETLNSEIKKAYQSYLTAAADPTKSNAEIEQWLKIIKRLRAVPGSATSLPLGAVEMEYNPLENLVTRRAGKKLVMVLSSNPDDVINQIAGFSQSTETSASVLRLGQLFEQQQKSQTAKELAEVNAASDDFVLLATQLEQVLADMEQAEKDELIRRLISVVTLAENMQ